MGYNHIAGMLDSTKKALSEWKNDYITNGMFSNTPSEKAKTSMTLANVLGQFASAYDKSIGGTGAIGDAVVNMTNTAKANQARKNASSKQPVKASSVVPTPAAVSAPVIPIAAPGVPDTKTTPIPDATATTKTAPVTAPIVAPAVQSNAEVNPVMAALNAGNRSPAYKEPVTASLLEVAMNAINSAGNVDTVPGWSGEGTALLPITMQDKLAEEQNAVVNRNVAKTQATAEILSSLFGAGSKATNIFSPFIDEVMTEKGPIKKALAATGDTKELGKSVPNMKVDQGMSGDNLITFSIDPATGKWKQIVKGTPPQTGIAGAKAADNTLDRDVQYMKIITDNMKTLTDKTAKGANAREIHPIVANINNATSQLSTADKTFYGVVDAGKEGKSIFQGKKQVSAFYPIPNDIYMRKLSGRLTEADRDYLAEEEIKAISSNFGISYEDAVKAIKQK